IYRIFSNAELPYPTVTLSNGEKVLLNSAGYGRYRAVANRSDRELVFSQFFSTLKKFSNTFGSQLAAHVNTHIFNMRARGYSTCLDASLDQNNIPTEVYLNLIKNVNDNLDSFHRYLTLKKRMLGVDTLKYSDVYAPVVKGLDMEYDIEEAVQMILAAVEPLGEEYTRVVKKAMEERWVDVYPTPGKRSGAYSAGDIYDVHPYILLNYTGLYYDVSTYAHELGHTMQSYLSNQNQPAPLAQYPIFTAEVASTLNEHLLMHKQLSLLKDDKLQLTLMMNFLDNVKGTVFRQAQFAEFELEMHRMAERGESLTGESLSNLYGGILKKYYGHEKKVCFIDDLYSIEWAFIPHFYYNFYVYQYATSFTASTALSEKILAQEPGAKGKYIDFLSAGGSDYPIHLLKNAGVDITTSEPFDKTMTAMNKAMAKIEEIITRVE
ncbi:oligoendopeptidase F family protein, partial [candidate division KSB1 bacterium]|nr:oligoendopeptidase F family protein [candidate division KSB1 bacterium]